MSDQEGGVDFVDVPLVAVAADVCMQEMFDRLEAGFRCFEVGHVEYAGKDDR